jgi:hypothetical protein
LPRLQPKAGPSLVARGLTGAGLDDVVYQQGGQVAVGHGGGVDVSELLLGGEDLDDLLQHRHVVEPGRLGAEVVPGLCQLAHVRGTGGSREGHNEEVVQAVDGGGLEVVAAISSVTVTR